MIEIVAQLNVLVALGAVASQAAALVLLFLWWRSRSGTSFRIISFVRSYGIHLVFLISTVGVIASLVYSEIFGFIPCGLCWFQRIFLYPIAVLSGLALWKRDRAVADYLIALSIPGAVIALYQHYLQMGGSTLIECPATGAGADCAQRFLFEFGYITFPLIAFSSFALLCVLALIVRSKKE